VLKQRLSVSNYERDRRGMCRAKLKGKRPIGRLRHRWEDGIRMDLREIDWGGTEWLRIGADGSLL